MFVDNTLSSAAPKQTTKQQTQSRNATVALHPHF